MIFDILKLISPTPGKGGSEAKWYLGGSLSLHFPSFAMQQMILIFISPLQRVVRNTVRLPHSGLLESYRGGFGKRHLQSILSQSYQHKRQYKEDNLENLKTFLEELSGRKEFLRLQKDSSWCKKPWLVSQKTGVSKQTSTLRTVALTKTAKLWGPQFFFSQLYMRGSVPFSQVWCKNLWGSV